MEDDNGGFDERNTYNARTSKFLATTWRKFPEPISLLLLILIFVSGPVDLLVWRETAYSDTRFKKVLWKGIGKGFWWELIFRKNPMVHERRGTEFWKSSSVVSAFFRTASTNNVLPRHYNNSISYLCTKIFYVLVWKKVKSALININRVILGIKIDGLIKL